MTMIIPAMKTITRSTVRIIWTMSPNTFMRTIAIPPWVTALRLTSRISRLSPSVSRLLQQLLQDTAANGGGVYFTANNISELADGL